MKEIYLDNSAATSVDPRVLSAMLPYFSEICGNPSSFNSAGKLAKDAVERAREKVARIFNSKIDEVIFTAGGTEANNLAILGYARANREKGNHLITQKTEHHSVLEAMEHLEKKEGFKVTYLDVDEYGLVDSKKLEAAITKETILVSIMYANNEIGTVEPIAEMGKIIAAKRQELGSALRFHSDACQAAGSLDLDVNRLHIDLLTINGSKIYGPKNVGVLYIKTGVKLQPLIFGGPQERALRPGTENVPGIVGLSVALEIAQNEKEKENSRLTAIRDRLINGILSTIPKSVLNGHPAKRLPNNVNISILDIEGEALVLYLDAKGVYASTGSACTSASLDPSHVIVATGMPYEASHGSLRLTLGRQTTAEDAEYVIKILPEIVEKLRAISPVNLDMKHYKRVLSG
ncbi:aminotransferase class V-fold PLP-dependent enzyme [Candidatus Uhrbacteria bacterium]|nr:aminotransferase class V-fold PLP-dependent enzyme [Candidatus Uhrbacteria bacterium]